MINCLQLIYMLDDNIPPEKKIGQLVDTFPNYFHKTLETSFLKVDYLLFLSQMDWDVFTSLVQAVFYVLKDMLCLMHLLLFSTLWFLVIQLRQTRIGQALQKIYFSWSANTHICSILCFHYYIVPWGHSNQASWPFLWLYATYCPIDFLPKY